MGSDPLTKFLSQNQSRECQWCIENHEEHHDEADQVRDDGLRYLRHRKSRDTRGDEEVNRYRRGDHTDGEADREYHTEVDEVHTHRLHERKEHRGEQDDRGGGLHEDTSDQDDKTDQEEDDVGIARNREHGLRNHLRDFPVRQHPAERTGEADDQHDDGRGLRRVLHDLHEKNLISSYSFQFSIILLKFLLIQFLVQLYKQFLSFSKFSPQILFLNLNIINSLFSPLIFLKQIKFIYYEVYII